MNVLNCHREYGKFPKVAIKWCLCLKSSPSIALMNYTFMPSEYLRYCLNEDSMSVSVTKNWTATQRNQQNECAPSEDSDQPGHPPSLIRVFAVRSMAKDPCFLHADSKVWSDWADAQADLSLRWAHTHFFGFVMSRLICNNGDKHLSHVTRKPVFGVRDQVRLKPACSATETR